MHVQGQTIVQLVWALSKYHVSFDQVVNIDESALLLCPSPTKTWTFKGSQAQTENYNSSKRCTMTVTVTASMRFPDQCQVIFAGKVARTTVPDPWCGHMAIEQPLKQPIFLDARPTMVTQPLDIAYFSSLNAVGEI